MGGILMLRRVVSYCTAEKRVVMRVRGVGVSVAWRDGMNAWKGNQLLYIQIHMNHVFSLVFYSMPFLPSLPRAKERKGKAAKTAQTKPPYCPNAKSQARARTKPSNKYHIVKQSVPLLHSFILPLSHLIIPQTRKHHTTNRDRNKAMN